ncbi:MAG: prepilin-type N-terminal cleavage/methylation domain-containing protein [Planctomycetota bacterium]
MQRFKKNAGFTLIELMIVVAIIAIIASIAIPKLMSARISANENAAVATLRSIASAQAQIESACAIDTDADGGGEFGYFAELAGVGPLRIYDAATDTAVLGTDGADELTPPILGTAFGDIIEDANGEGVVERAGYLFKMFLPDATAQGVGEDPAGLGAATLPDPDEAEILWCCYAWPADTGKTGNRAFFINQEGDLLQTANVEGATNTVIFYSNSNVAAQIPLFSAALDTADMGAPLGITAMGLTPVDGNVWSVVGN